MSFGDLRLSSVIRSANALFRSPFSPPGRTSPRSPLERSGDSSEAADLGDGSNWPSGTGDDIHAHGSTCSATTACSLSSLALCDTARRSTVALIVSRQGIGSGAMRLGKRGGGRSSGLSAGGDLFKLQKIGGWRSFEMVQRYAHLAPGAFADDYERLGAAATGETLVALAARGGRPAGCSSRCS